jgi:acetoin utilization deacetylase AcuC-like enzyme
LYPGSGMLDEIGAGAGLGYTANLPFPPGSGDAAYSTAMQTIIPSLLERFQPEMILVSVGFDAHWRDPLGHLQLSAAGYGSLVRRLVEWADENCRSRIILVLEGGYDLQAVAACSLACTAALLGEPFSDPLGPSPRAEGKSWQPMLEKASMLWQLNKPKPKEQLNG